MRMLEPGQDVALAREASARSRRSRLMRGSFSATSRSNAPSARSASQTSAMPPAPSSRFRRYGPMRSPRRPGRWPASRPLPPASATRQQVGGFARRMRSEQLAQHGASSGCVTPAAPARPRARPGRDRAPRRAASTTCSRWRQRYPWTRRHIRNGAATGQMPSFLQRREQERARLVPLAAHGALRRPEQLGDLDLAVAREVAHLDDRASSASTASSASSASLTESASCRQLPRSFGRRGRCPASRRGAATAPLGQLLAREVDDDVAHRLRRIGEEVLAVVEHEIGRIDELQEALVNEVVVPRCASSPCMRRRPWAILRSSGYKTANTRSSAPRSPCAASCDSCVSGTSTRAMAAVSPVFRWLSRGHGRVRVEFSAVCAVIFTKTRGRFRFLTKVAIETRQVGQRDRRLCGGSHVDYSSGRIGGLTA